jgi:hypothetical protein
VLKSVKLGFTESQDLELPVDGVTIYVGPNNSGKSLVLREVEQTHLNNPLPKNLKILKDFEVNWPSEEEIDTLIKRHRRNAEERNSDDIVRFGKLSFFSSPDTQDYNKNHLRNIALDQSDKGNLLCHYARWGLIRLDGRSRFNLTNDQNAGDLLSAPINILSHIFTDDVTRQQVRALIHEAFGLYFVVDPTRLGSLRIKLSHATPPDDEQSLNANARAFYQNAIHIKDASDGVQAFVGIATAVLSGDYHTILVDEPEAFLHPPLARKLGRSLAKLVTERGGSLMASTHSSDFLMGCIQASKQVRVVRLEYANGKSNALS